MSNKQASAKDQFFRDLEDNYGSSIATIHLKNSDYATDIDPFFNFRRAAEFAGVSVERGMLVRIGDKWGRFANLLRKEEEGSGTNEVTDETTEDTLRDLLGYTNILAVYRKWKREPVEGYLYSGELANYDLPTEPLTEEEEDRYYPSNEPAPGLDEIDNLGPEPEHASTDQEVAGAAEKLRRFFFRQ